MKWLYKEVVRVRFRVRIMVKVRVWVTVRVRVYGQGFKSIFNFVCPSHILLENVFKLVT